MTLMSIKGGLTDECAGNSYDLAIKKTLGKLDALDRWDIDTYVEHFGIQSDSNFWRHQTEKLDDSKPRAEAQFELINLLKSPQSPANFVQYSLFPGQELTYHSTELQKRINLISKSQHAGITGKQIIESMLSSGTVRTGTWGLDFADIPLPFRHEIKLYFAIRLNDPRMRSRVWFGRTRLLVAWLREDAGSFGDKWLVDCEPLELREKFKIYLDKHHYSLKKQKQTYLKDGNFVDELYDNSTTMPANDLHYVLFLFRESLKPLEKRDWILATDLGFDLPKRSRSDELINLLKIKTPWLRAATREWLVFKVLSEKIAWSTMKGGGLFAQIVKFDHFLQIKFQNPKPTDITKALLVKDYKEWGFSKGFKGYQWFSDLCQLIHFAADRELPGWPRITITSAHFPRPRKPTRQYLEESVDRATPPEVIAQILEHLEDLPAYLQRMLVLGRYTGWRSKELLECPYDVLREDDDMFMQLVVFQSKTSNLNRQLVKKDDPTGQLIIQVVSDQRKDVDRQWPNGNCNYLFPGPKVGDAPASPLQHRTISLAIKKLCKDHKIKDPRTGKIFNFRWHGLRHARGTELAMQGYDIFFIMDELGHATSAMTIHYINRRLEIKKKAVERSGTGHLIDIKGNIVGHIDSLALSHKKEMLISTRVSGGICKLPAQIGEWCEHAHACLGCKHYHADSSSKDYFLHERVEIEKTILLQTQQIEDLGQAGRIRQKDIIVKRLERNKCALEGCSRILNSIETLGEYSGSESNFKRTEG